MNKIVPKKQADMTILIYSKTFFKQNLGRRDRQGHYIFINEVIH